MRIPIKAKVTPSKATSAVLSRASPFVSKTEAAGKVVDKFTGILDKLAQKQQQDKADLLAIETESTKKDFEAGLQAFNVDFLQQVASGEVSEEQIDKAYSDGSSELFDKTIADKQFSFDNKAAKTKFETENYQIARTNFTENIAKQLPTIDLAKKQQALTGLTTRLTTATNNPTADLSALTEKIRSPSVMRVMKQVYGDDALLERSKAVTTITNSYFNNQANHLSEQGDVAGLEALTAQLKTHGDLPDELKQTTLSRLSLLTDRTMGNTMATNYLVEHFDKNKPYDEEAAKAYIDQHKELTAEQQQAFLTSVQLQAKQLQSVQQTVIDSAKLQMMDTLDVSKIPAEQWNQLPDKAKQEIQAFTAAQQTDTKRFNQQLYSLLKGDKIDVLSTDNSHAITPYDLKELYQRQQLLLADPTQQRQANNISLLVEEAFKARGITDEQQKANNVALIINELDGVQRVNQQPLTAGDIQQAIKRVLPTPLKQQPFD